MRPPASDQEFNTFTVIGRCEKTGAIGVCLASSPLTVASRCPYFEGDLAAVSTQCFTNPTLGPIMLGLLRAGYTPKQTIEALRVKDEHFEWRQIGIVTLAGETAVHSGENGKPFTGHVTGDGYICMGNNLVGPHVIEAMAKAFTANAGELLEERLMRALEAGSKAGGEPKGQLSAGIMVGDASQRRPRTDLRVEMANPTPKEGGDAVRDLRRVVDAFKPMIRYYQVWHTDPTMQYWRDWNADENIAARA
jgi:uncharacterized Ntn-hydrolase superfamily protein